LKKRKEQANGHTSSFGLIGKKYIDE